MMASTHRGPPRKVIFDTDAGVDDAHALLIFDSASPEHIDLLGVTCVAGNVKLEQAVTNMSHVLKHCYFPNATVYAGADRPLVGKRPPGYEIYHGTDGLGNTLLEKTAPSTKFISTKHAVEFLIEAVKNNPKEVSVCSVGPLTNLALAERMWPQFSANLKSVIIMGGNIYGIGNVTPSAEFNFYADAEAAQIVMRDFSCEKVLVSWELSQKYAISMVTLQEMFATNSSKARFLEDITRHALKTEKDHLSICDQLAAICTMHPELITKSYRHSCKVSLFGETRGQVVIDRKGLWADFPEDSKTTIVEEVDAHKLHEIHVRSMRESGGISVAES